jgi:hypothetical protein
MSAPVLSLTSGSNSERLISAFVFEQAVVRTFYDHLSDRWVFESWRNAQRIDHSHSAIDAASIEALFARAVRQHLDTRRVHQTRAINADYLPEGVSGIRTFDPRRRSTRRLFPFRDD